MDEELLVLAWGALLLIVHIFVAGHFKTKQYGADWNMGARDEDLPPLNPLAGRAVRAQTNFQETFPVVIVALLGVIIAGRTSDWTATGAWIWLVARVVYLPLYLAGIKYVRTVVFLISLVGIGMALYPLLTLS